MTTPKLQLPELVVGQPGKELTHNQALAILSQLVQANVVDKDLAAPPVSPADGAMYIVAASATDAWAGKSGQLAFWLSSVGAWTFAVPVNGWRVWVTDEAEYYKLKAGAWIIDAGGGGGLTNPMTAAGDLIVGGASGVPTRLAKGAEGQVLKMVGGTEAWAAESGGAGLLNVTESKISSAPNATVPVVALSVSGAESSIDLALISKGSNSAVMLHIPDGTTAGGNKRGVASVDMQRDRTNANHVASGAYSGVISGRSNKATDQSAGVFVGESNSATGINSVVIGGSGSTTSGNGSFVGGGATATASANYAVTLGGSSPVASGIASFIGSGYSNTASASFSSVVGGRDNLADGDHSSISGGNKATTRSTFGAEARASGQFSSQGDAQRRRFMLRCATTSATPAVLSADGSTATSTTQITLPNNSTYLFTANIVSRSGADQAAWCVTGLVTRGANAAATAIVGTPTITAIASSAGASGWGLAVTVDTTLGGLKLTATGVAATNIKWVADIETVEVVG